jgi:hypothetical protein
MTWRPIVVVILILQFSLPALAFDRASLMKLDPLPSVRYKQIGDNAQRDKLILTAGYGLSGGWIIYNNINKGYDAYRVNNILAGSTLMVTALINYLVPSSFKNDQELMQELKLEGEEKEANAYFLIKSNAKDSQITRRAAALMYFLSGLSSAIIAGSSTNLTDNERFWTNVNAVGFLGLAAYQLFWPSEVETVARQLDRELAR